jgi:hypothetical protein
MEQQLDATYLRPSFLSKAVALSAACLGLGVAILLGSFGLSLIWRSSLPASIDLRITNPELKIRQDEPFLFKTVEEPRKIEPPISRSSDVYVTPHGEVIQQEVIVFSSVNHASGSVVTGWKFPNGKGGVPSGQFCYFIYPNPDQSSTRVDIAFDAKALATELVANVPEVERALGKCQWWHA